MKQIISLLFISSILNATAVENWRGETLVLNVSMKHTTHLIFDEEIVSDIYPKEENLNIVRNGKNVFFRYNPFVKYKVTKNDKNTKKVKDGVSYKGSPVKVWFVGKETGTNYAIKFNPVYTEEDTFYIRNKAANLEKKIAKQSQDPREKQITTLAKRAAIGAAIDGYDFSVPNKQIEATEEYIITLSKSYEGVLYDVDVYTIRALIPTHLNEFEFLSLPKNKKVFIGLSDGWSSELPIDSKSDIVIVSER